MKQEQLCEVWGIFSLFFDSATFFSQSPFFLFLYNHAFCNNIPPKNFWGVPYCGGTGSNLGVTEFGGILLWGDINLYPPLVVIVANICPKKTVGRGVKQDST